MKRRRRPLRCPRLFEPGADPRGTHTCNRQARHHGRHTCPRCGVEWLSTTGPGPGKVVRPL